MSQQEFCNQKMREVSKPIDLENDPFANLFKEKNPPVETGRHSVLVEKLVRARNERKMPEKAVSVARPTDAARQKAPLPSVKEQKSDGMSLYLLFPVASLALCGVFLAGYYGGNFAGGKLARKPVQVASLAAVPIAPAAKPAKSAELDPGQQVARLTTEIARQKLVTAPVIQATQPMAVPVPKAEKQPVQVASLSTPVLLGPRQILDYGHQLERAGDLSAARVRFLQAFEAGASAGALAIARTYDRRFHPSSPDILKEQDARLAREWYEKWYLSALQKGEISARARYDRLLKGLQKS